MYYAYITKFPKTLCNILLIKISKNDMNLIAAHVNQKAICFIFVVLQFWKLKLFSLFFENCWYLNFVHMFFENIEISKVFIVLGEILRFQFFSFFSGLANPFKTNQKSLNLSKMFQKHKSWTFQEFGKPHPKSWNRRLYFLFRSILKSY